MRLDGEVKGGKEGGRTWRRKGREKKIMRRKAT